MRSTRLKISYLRNKISDLLPDENDILGYAGISNILIIESLNESYNLLSLLEAYNEKFETILAKRNVAHLIDNANHYLNEIWNSEQKADRFNDFLNSIAQIRFTLKESYLSLTENTLKLEIEIVQAKEALEELTVDLEEIKHTRTEINLIKTESSEFIQELEQKHKLSIENETRINKFVENIELIDADLKGTSEKINVWKSEVQTIREDITKKQAEFIKIKTEIEQVQENNENNEEILEGLIKTLNEQLELNDKHQDYIKKTIEDVSRAGMAGSFKKRKDELKWIQFFWAVLTIASISGLLILSYTIVKPLIDSQAFELNQLLIKIPVFASAVWLGGFVQNNTALLLE